MSRVKRPIEHFLAYAYTPQMFMILGIIFGVIFGIVRGRWLSNDRADRVMYIASFGLAGFTIGIILTFFIQIFI